MIKLDAYINNGKRKKVITAFLKMLPGVLPFLESDIEDAIKIICQEENIEWPFEGKQTLLHNKKRRTDNYRTALQKNGIKGKVREQEDALYAKNIISHEEKLFNFLYKDYANNQYGNINPLRLAKLLSAWPQDLVQEIGICNNYTEEMLSDIFCYEKMRSANAEALYNFVQEIDATVCPYCNQNYTYSYYSQHYKIRPELDHYYIKSKYPYLAVNMKNLVPACHVCNHAKGNNMSIHLYPYKEGAEDDIVFQTMPVKSLDYLVGNPEAINDFEIVDIIKTKQGSKYDRICTSKDIFGWEKLNNFHKAYILRIFQQRYIFSEPYITSIVNNSGGLFRDREEVYDLLSLHPTDQASWSSVPLSKLTHDIRQEIDSLQEE